MLCTVTFPYELKSHHHCKWIFLTKICAVCQINLCPGLRKQVYQHVKFDLILSVEILDSVLYYNTSFIMHIATEIYREFNKT